MLAVKLVLLLFFSYLLIKSVDALILSVNRLAEISRLGKFTLSTLILAVATSLPELVVSVTSAAAGNSHLALGTIVGSNIADISLVIGGAAVIGRGFSVAGAWLKVDIFSVFLAGALPLVLLLDNYLSRSDGLLLLAIFGLYYYSVLHRKITGERHSSRLLRPMLDRPATHRGGRWVIKLLLAAGMLLISAEMMVKLGMAAAQELKVSVFLIGLFLVAVGTSLPELSFEIESIRKRQVGMALGDLFGSIVANSTLILGLVAVINPIRLVNGWQEYGLAAAAFGVVFLLFWGFIRSKKKLEWWEGLVLIAAYAVFVLLEWSKT